MKPAQKAWAEFGWQVLGALLVAAAIGGLYARGESTRDLSPCAENPRGGRCAEQREAVARAEPIRNPCIASQRVTGQRGRFCPRFYVKRPSSRGPTFNVTPTAGETAGTTTAEGEGRAPAGGATGGNHQAEVPAHQDPPPTKAPPPSPAASETPVASQGPAPGAAPDEDETGGAPASTGPVEQITGTAAGVVDQAGKDVQQTVDNAARNPPVSLCPK